MSLAPSIPSIKVKVGRVAPPPPHRACRSFAVIRSSKAEGPRRPAAPPLSPPPPMPPKAPALSTPPSLSQPPTPVKPAAPSTPPPETKPAAPVAVAPVAAGTPPVGGVVTFEYQRKVAKELQDYFKKKKLEESNQGPFFGWLAKNEIANGSAGAPDVATIKLRFGSEEIIFDMRNPTHLPICRDQCFAMDVVDQCVFETLSEKEAVTECESDLIPKSLMELKPLPSHLKYAFLEKEMKFPVIVSATLTEIQVEALLNVLRKYRRVIGYSIEDMIGISPAICTHKIYLENDCRPTREHQRRLNPSLQEVVKKEIMKLLAAGIIYPISDSEWVSPIHVVPKKGGMTVVENEKGMLIPTRTVTGHRMCTDYRKLIPKMIDCRTAVGMSPKLRVVVFTTGTRRSTIELGLKLGQSIAGVNKLTEKKLNKAS